MQNPNSITIGGNGSYNGSYGGGAGVQVDVNKEHRLRQALNHTHEMRKGLNRLKRRRCK